MGAEEIQPRSGFSSPQCFVAAYEDAVGRLVAEIEGAVAGEEEWGARLAAGIDAGLGYLAANPHLAHLLLVESLAASRPARLEHERSLVRLARALRAPGDDLAGSGRSSEETSRLLAGGLASLLSGRVLAGEAERLPESRDLLLGYLLAPSFPDAARDAAGFHAGG